MQRNNYQSRNLIGHYPFWVISPRNSTSFTRPFLAGRRAWAGHETTTAYAEVMIQWVCIITGFAQKVQIKNMECLQKVIWERPRGIPLVTISNHASCMDDPAIPSEFGLIDWSINRLIDWWIDWSISWSIDCLIDWSIDGLMDWWIDWLIDWLIDRSIDWMNDCVWLIDWLTDWLNEWLTDWRTDSLTADWFMCFRLRQQ